MESGQSQQLNPGLFDPRPWGLNEIMHEMHSALARLLETTQYILNATNSIIVLHFIISLIMFCDQTGDWRSQGQGQFWVLSATFVELIKRGRRDRPPAPTSFTLI